MKAASIIKKAIRERYDASRVEFKAGMFIAYWIGGSKTYIGYCDDFKIQATASGDTVITFPDAKTFTMQ